MTEFEKSLVTLQLALSKHGIQLYRLTSSSHTCMNVSRDFARLLSKITIIFHARLKSESLRLHLLIQQQLRTHQSSHTTQMEKKLVGETSAEKMRHQITSIN